MSDQSSSHHAFVERAIQQTRDHGGLVTPTGHIDTHGRTAAYRDERLNTDALGREHDDEGSDSRYRLPVPPPLDHHLSGY